MGHAILLNTTTPASAFAAELVPRFAAAFDFDKSPLPTRYADVVCGIGLSSAAINSLWPSCTDVECVAVKGGSQTTKLVDAAARLLWAGQPALAMASRLADAAEYWILLSLGITSANIKEKGPRARR